MTPHERDGAASPLAPGDLSQSPDSAGGDVISFRQNWSNLKPYSAGLVVVSAIAATTAMSFIAVKGGGWDPTMAVQVDTVAHLVGLGFAVIVGIRNGRPEGPLLGLASPFVAVVIVLQGLGSYSSMDDLARSEADPIPAAYLVGTAVLGLAVLLACRPRSGAGQAADLSVPPERKADSKAVDATPEVPHRTGLSASIRQSVVAEKRFEEDVEQSLTRLFERRRLRAITEMEYQKQLLEVRRLVAQRAEGATTVGGAERRMTG